MSERYRVDVERLRESVRHVGADGWSSVRGPSLAALLAVVDAARKAEHVERFGCAYKRGELT